MPTIFTLYGSRFMFYSNDHEPIHIHTIKDNSRAKFDLFPSVALVSSSGVKAHELRLLEQVVVENREHIIEQWLIYFNSDRRYERN